MLGYRIEYVSVFVLEDSEILLLLSCFDFVLNLLILLLSCCIDFVCFTLWL